MHDLKVQASMIECTKIARTSAVAAPISPLPEIVRAACLQNETAPETFLKRYEKRFEKCEKGSEKRSETRLKKF